MLTPELLIGLVTLAALEIVLGVDNLIFQSIIASKLPTPELREKARKLGLLSALASRIVLISCIGFIVGLTAPLFTIGTFTATGRDLALLAGGLVLTVIWNAKKGLPSSKDPRAPEGVRPNTLYA